MNGSDIATDVMLTTILTDKFVPERQKKKNGNMIQSVYIAN